MKKILIFLLILFPIYLGAQAVSVEKAQKIAENYFKQTNTKVAYSNNNIKLLEQAIIPINGKEQTLYYIFEKENNAPSKQKNLNQTDSEELPQEGFIILSGNEALEPILGYSDDSPIHENPSERSPEFTYWLQQYEQQIIDAWLLNLKATPEIEAKWANLEKANNTTTASKAAAAAVEPLLSTRWDQGSPYNASCPSSFFGGTAVTGCVATAMAQVMKYHNHPPQGEGYHSYNSNQYGTLSADYGATSYAWNSMTNQPTNASPAIATLMYHCGVSVNMNYSPQSSGAYVIESDAQNCSEKAFKEYFGYDATSVDGVRRQNYNNTQWINLIRAELEAKRPVLYAGFGNGGGHCFVCDGVDNSNLFHFNWGWGGYEDGYFQMSALNPNLGGTGAGNGGYNSGQQAVIGVKPAYGDNNGGGTPTPPNPNDDAFYGLKLFSQLDISQSPLDFNQGFELYAEIGNYGTTSVTGTYAAILHDEADNQIAVINPQNKTIQGGTYDTFTFSTAGLTAVPGAYSLGVYYKAASGDWRLINKGDFFNPGGVNIEGIDNNIKVYSAITINPTPVQQAQPFSINVDIANFGNTNFLGNISVDLYTLNGDYISELDITNASLQQQTFNTYTFQNAGLSQIEPGTYLLVLWNQLSNGNWEIIGSTDDHKNPVYINIAAPGLQPDNYENNNTSANAYKAVPSFNGNNGTFQTQNTNIHNADDIDYFEIDLPLGTYTVTAQVKDSYNNASSYTNDMLFAYKKTGGDWSDTFDSSMPNITLSNGEKVTFAVASYFVGTTGTYQFIAQVNGEPYTSTNIIETQAINLYPNPTNGVAYLDNLPNEATFVKLFSIEGKLLDTQKIGAANELIALELSQYAAGVYFVEITNNEGAILSREKIVYQN